MIRLALFLALFLVSCTGYEHLAYSAKTGNYERDRLVKFGGTASQQGADGSSLATDDQASFQVAAQGLGAYGAGLVASSVQKAKETTAQVASTNAAKVQISAQQATAQQAAATTAARASTTSQAISAGAPLSPVTVNPP